MISIKTILLAIALAFALFFACGCATKKELVRPAVSSAAFVATESAKLHIAKARIAVEKTKAGHPEAIADVSAALQKADVALDDAGKKIEGLQTYSEQLATAKDAAEAKAQKEETAKKYWRALSLKLIAVAALLGLWIFRRPLLALLGVPTF